MSCQLVTKLCLIAGGRISSTDLLCIDPSSVGNLVARDQKSFQWQTVRARAHQHVLQVQGWARTWPKLQTEKGPCVSQTVIRWRAVSQQCMQGKVQQEELKLSSPQAEPEHDSYLDPCHTCNTNTSPRSPLALPTSTSNSRSWPLKRTCS